MDTNQLTIYKGSSKEVITTVTGLVTISGYSAVMTVMNNAFSTGSTFTVTGTTNISNNTVQFSLTPAITNIDEGVYYYDIVLFNSDNTDNYIVVQSNLLILTSSIALT